MNVLLIGDGGREHALAWSISQSHSLDHLFASDSNPGIAKLSTSVTYDLNNITGLINLCFDKRIDLVVIGPEYPLSIGLADELRKAGVNVFGPSRNAAILESSKSFAKNFMKKYNIPTAGYEIFRSDEIEKAVDYIKKSSFPLVLKADGLAAGKGVIIADDIDKAVNSVYEMFSGKFSDAGKTVVIEEFMKGEEASILAVTDSINYITLAPAQDHKRVYNGDKGPNTGGMGAYAPAPVVTGEILKKVREKIIEPTLAGMIKDGNPFIGCLYVGIMIDRGEPKVVEYNVRFGDPETQAVLPLIEGDFLKLIYSASIGKLDKQSVSNVANGYACCVVAASDGYPGKFDKGFEIHGLGEAENSGSIVFHAGTKMLEGKTITNGGRILGVTGTAGSLKESVNNTYSAIYKIRFDNIYYRTDIAHRALKND